MAAFIATPVRTASRRLAWPCATCLHSSRALFANAWIFASAAPSCASLTACFALLACSSGLTSDSASHAARLLASHDSASVRFSSTDL